MCKSENREHQAHKKEKAMPPTVVGDIAFSKNQTQLTSYYQGNGNLPELPLRRRL